MLDDTETIYNTSGTPENGQFQPYLSNMTLDPTIVHNVNMTWGRATLGTNYLTFNHFVVIGGYVLQSLLPNIPRVDQFGVDQKRQIPLLSRPRRQKRLHLLS